MDKIKHWDTIKNFKTAVLYKDEVFRVVPQRHYPHRIPPKEWPDVKLIGKAMARGWAVPCRYYPRFRRARPFILPYVYPGITDAEMKAISLIMRGIE